jgi:hypothetical protein
MLALGFSVNDVASAFGVSVAACGGRGLWFDHFDFDNFSQHSFNGCGLQASLRRNDFVLDDFIILFSRF